LATRPVTSPPLSALPKPAVRVASVAAQPPPAAAVSPLLDTRLARAAHRLLAGLGTSRGSVAAVLEDAHVRGVPQDPEQSPVQLYLRAVMGADPNVRSVRLDAGAVVLDPRAWWRPPVTVPVPAVVHEFSAIFDAGCYPGLIREDHRADWIHRVPGPSSKRVE
jgi:hypothetical protein